MPKTAGLLNSSVRPPSVTVYFVYQNSLGKMFHNTEIFRKGSVKYFVFSNPEQTSSARVGQTEPTRLATEKEHLSNASEVPRFTVLFDSYDLTQKKSQNK